MFTIGDFARHGRVSVRMLRHYDAIGLLRPASVDQGTGYRRYLAGQLSRLNRIVALKDLGFTLDQVRSVLDDEVSGEQLRGMLRLRQEELRAAIAADTARLTRVDARLRIIEMEGPVSTNLPTDDVQIKTLPAVRVAELTATASELTPTVIGPVIQPLYGRLFDQLERAGVAPVGPAIAYYEDAPDGTGVLVHACVPVNADPRRHPDAEFAVVDLPAVERAATLVHHGSMDNVDSSIQTLAVWLEANNERSAGAPRELYLQARCDMSEWVTELQEPLAAS